jgi:hypothetical protein
MPRPRERHERQVHGVQHQLDAQEHDDRVAAHRHPNVPIDEEDRLSTSARGGHETSPLGEDDRAHDGHEQQDAGDLEGDDVVRVERPGDRADRAVLGHGRLDAPHPGRRRSSTKAPSWRASRPPMPPATAKPPRSSTPARSRLVVVAEVQQHDHEQEEHHDRARVDDHLDRREEVRLQQHVVAATAKSDTMKSRPATGFPRHHADRAATAIEAKT